VAEYQDSRISGKRTEDRRRKTEGRRLRTEDRRRKAENCSKRDALDKHVVLLISQKDYVPFYKLPRWIMDYWAVRKYDEDMYRPCGSKSNWYLVRPAGREMFWK